MLRTVTNRSLGIGVDTANGFSRVEAIGTALIYLNHGGTVGWVCYELPHVLVMPNCDAVLYSTRTMRDLFGFRHDFDSATPSITCPGRPGWHLDHRRWCWLSHPPRFCSRRSPAAFIHCSGRR